MVAVLGPAGAGKTTLMRVLAGLSPLSAGRVSIAGYDLVEQPKDALRHLGFVSAPPPLYPELIVDEYLAFVARIRGLNGNRSAGCLAELKERCGLKRVGSRLISSLDADLHFRVGVAQALIHQPRVLLLDEPGRGFASEYPNAYRELIEGLDGDQAILLATSSPRDLGTKCARAIVLHRGRVLIADSPQRLRTRLSRGSQLRIEVAGPVEALPRRLEKLPHVRRARLGDPQHGNHLLTIEGDGKEDIRPQVARCVIESGCRLYELRQPIQSLEEIFSKMGAESDGDE